MLGFIFQHHGLHMGYRNFRVGFTHELVDNSALFFSSTKSETLRKHHIPNTCIDKKSWKMWHSKKIEETEFQKHTHPRFNTLQIGKSSFFPSKFIELRRPSKCHQIPPNTKIVREKTSFLRRKKNGWCIWICEPRHPWPPLACSQDQHWSFRGLQWSPPGLWKGSALQTWTQCCSLV